jgi:MOSC domain-containing protein YiiM
VATIKGKIKAISLSKEKGTKKVNVPGAELKADFGLVGDAHAGTAIRQVSLLAIEPINKMIEKGAKVSPGDFAENITTEGIDLQKLRIGSMIKIGDTVELQITQFGKKCHKGCEIYDMIGDCIMPKEGVFAKVIKSGNIKVGDAVEVTDD